MTEIGKLFTQHKTDKCELHYDIPYQEHLPKIVGKLLEIGVWKGGGLRAFKDFYKGAGEFHGINYVFGNSDIPSQASFIKDGFICHEGYQQDIDFLESIKDQFDVIIDDGSHHSDDQIATFKHMFKHNLSSGGLYIVEDLHCCTQSYWWNSINGFKNTFLGVALRVNKGGAWTSQMFSLEDNKYFKSNVKKMILAGDRNESIAFIWKGYAD